MKKGKIRRHSKVEMLIHWSIALSTFVLIFSGFGQMPLYSRYNLVKVPGFSWTSDYIITIQMHYIAAIVLVSAVMFHIIYHYKVGNRAMLPKKGDVKESIKIIKAMLGKGEEPQSDKFLAEQRLAYAYIGINILLLIGTGFVKVIQNIDPLLLPHNMYVISTNVHNLATMLLILGIGAHLAAFVVKDNRPLISTMFTGKVDEEYVKHRHGIWYDKIKNKNKLNA